MYLIIGVYNTKTIPVFELSDSGAEPNVKQQIIKTHDSESRGQEEAGRTRRMSVLFTGSTGVKFVNALNKPPLQLSLSYQGPSTF